MLPVASVMPGVEMVAHEVEGPVDEGNDLLLEKFCATIEQSVRETLGTESTAVTSASLAEKG